MANLLPLLPVEGCQLCQRPPFDKKAGPTCETCPAFKTAHYHPFSDGPEVPDIIVLSDAPDPPRLMLIKGRDADPDSNYHPTFRDTGGKVLRQAVEDVGNDPEFKKLTAKYIYAVKCAVDPPSKKVVASCQGYLLAELGRMAAVREARGVPGGLVILACGVHALHALGVSAASEKKALGRVYEDVKIGGVTATVVVTRSVATYAGGAGKYNTLLADVERAARVARRKVIAPLTREEISKNYVYPSSVAETKDVVDHIIQYAGEGFDPAKWALAVDTETNTKHPQWKGLKMTAFSTAWDDGFAASFGLWHDDTAYDPALAFEHVKRLLQSGKPLIWHNGKYDYKVLWRHGLPRIDIGNAAWDTMLAEHLLEEDKRGEYSLKSLVKRFFPQYAGYEDVLQDMLAKFDAAEVREVSGSGERVVKLPPAVAEALERATNNKMVSGPGFRATSLEKILAADLSISQQQLQDMTLLLANQEASKRKKKEALTAPLTDQQRDDLRLLISAKKNGEFTAQAAKAAETVRKRNGGFEKVPLPELLFYACVDVDATRRLAIAQSQRMRDEDASMEAWRARVTAMLAAKPKISLPSRPGFVKKPDHEVQVTCTLKHPTHWIMREFKMPRQRELAKIELEGVTVDRKYVQWSRDKLSQVIATTSQQLYDLCGERFSLNSSQKIARFLFDGGVGFKHPDPEHAAEIAAAHPEDVRYVGGRLMYRAHHFTALNAIKTGEPVLKHLVSTYKCPFSNLLLSLKKAIKADTSFMTNADALAAMFEDDRLHGGYNLTGTATDRLSSSSGIDGLGFNFQNVIKGLIGALRDTRGNMVLDANDQPVFEGVSCKKIFIPDDPSMCFGNADAKGAEVTIFATYAKDKALVDALINGMDPHCFFACRALNPALVGKGLTGEARRKALEKAGIDDDHPWSYEDFKDRAKILKAGLGDKGKEKDRSTWLHPPMVEYAQRLDKLRDNIKRLVFGMLFGAGVNKTAEIAGISVELATQIKALLFTEFPSLPKYIEQTKWELRMFGIVETFHGGRRRFQIDTSRAPKDLLARAERQAVNFKVQRTNSDIVLMVLCWIAEALERDMGGRLLLTVHDSIGFQVPKKYAHQMPDLFKELGTKKVAEHCPWLLSPYRWDLTMGPSYGEQTPSAEYLKGLDIHSLINAPVAESRQVQLDGFTPEEVIDTLRDPEAFESFEDPSRGRPKKSKVTV